MRSFEGPTKATLAIASQMADYSKRSFDQSIKKICSVRNRWIKPSMCRPNTPGLLTKVCKPNNQVGPTLRRLGQGSFQVVPGFCGEGDASKVIASLKGKPVSAATHRRDAAAHALGALRGHVCAVIKPTCIPIRAVGRGAMDLRANTWRELPRPAQMRCRRPLAGHRVRNRRSRRRQLGHGFCSRSWSSPSQAVSNSSRNGSRVAPLNDKALERGNRSFRVTSIGDDLQPRKEGLYLIDIH
jgi:hypothetical protein